MGREEYKLPKVHFFSLNIVNGSLGRESALFVWWAERREKSSTRMEKAAANPPAASDMNTVEKMTPMQSLLMSCACAASRN